MSWNYDSTNLATNLAYIRLRIGDTNTDDQLLTDEEIAYIQTVHGSVLECAAQCCNAIIAKLARDTTRSAVGMSDSRNEVIQTYKDLRDSLLSENKLLAEGTSCGDSVSAHEDLTDDTDRVQPLFERAQFDNTTADNEDDD